jgi:hypothetical protein
MFNQCKIDRYCIEILQNFANFANIVMFNWFAIQFCMHKVGRQTFVKQSHITDVIEHTEHVLQSCSSI